MKFDELDAHCYWMLRKEGREEVEQTRHGLNQWYCR